MSTPRRSAGRASRQRSPSGSSLSLESGVWRSTRRTRCRSTRWTLTSATSPFISQRCCCPLELRGTDAIVRLRIAGAALLVCLLWGGVGPALKVGVRDAPPTGFVGVRMLSAVLWLLACVLERSVCLFGLLCRTGGGLGLPRFVL